MDSSAGREFFIKLVLLGTGTPIARKARHGPSQIVEIDGDLVLVDCGPGALHRLLESECDVYSFSHIVLTHLHSDHVSGLADVLWAGWEGRWWTTPPLLVGPPGTKVFVDRLLSAYEEDILLRSDEGAMDETGLRPEIIEVHDGWSLRNGNWRVTAFSVDHKPVKHAFGFRFEIASRSIVISGDTRRCDNLIKYAKDADLLVHEVAWDEGLRLSIEQSTGAARARFERILSYHTSSLEVGEIARLANVKHLVLSHLVGGGVPDVYMDDAQKSFSGEVSVGYDLETFVI